MVNCESKFDLKAANGAFLSKILEDLNNKKCERSILLVFCFIYFSYVNSHRE